MSPAHQAMIATRRFDLKKAYLLVAVVLSVFVLGTVGIAVKRLLFDGPQLERLIAHGVELQGHVSNPRSSGGRGASQLIDLNWISPAGTGCIVREHPISKEFFRTLSGREHAVLIDPNDVGCRAVLVGDLGFERRNASPVPFVGASVILGLAALLSALAALAACRNEQSPSPSS